MTLHCVFEKTAGMLLLHNYLYSSEMNGTGQSSCLLLPGYIKNTLDSGWRDGTALES